MMISSTSGKFYSIGLYSLYTHKVNKTELNTNAAYIEKHLLEQIRIAEYHSEVSFQYQLIDICEDIGNLTTIIETLVLHPNNFDKHAIS